jgi:hypothetical protein
MCDKTRHRINVRAQLAYPGRQSVAIVGDGGFAMLMAELSTAVAQNLPVKIILLKNNSLAEVKFEQKEIGNPENGCDLPPIDIVASAASVPTKFGLPSAPRSILRSRRLSRQSWTPKRGPRSRKN